MKESAIQSSHLVINLPWPSRDLHPNARVHWGRRSKAAKSARADAAWATHAAGIGKLDAERLRVTAIFTPPDNRPRDEDGMLSNIKSYLDGIADVIGVDDCKWSITIRREPARPLGNVRIEIVPADTWEHISEPLGCVIAAIPIPRKGAA